MRFVEGGASTGCWRPNRAPPIVLEVSLGVRRLQYEGQVDCRFGLAGRRRGVMRTWGCGWNASSAIACERDELR